MVLRSWKKKQLSRLFIKHVKSAGTAPENPVSQQPEARASSGQYGEELDREVNMEELNTVIKKLRPGTMRCILSFINKCIVERRMPEELNKGRIKLLFKADDRWVPRNYRPICVNSILSKLITRIITIRLTEIVERENLLEDSQFSFQKKRSTLDAVVVLNTVITGFKLDLKIKKKEGASDKLKDNLFICFIRLEKE